MTRLRAPRRLPQLRGARKQTGPSSGGPARPIGVIRRVENNPRRPAGEHRAMLASTTSSGHDHRQSGCVVGC